jgi:dTMP kinase
LRKFYTFEGSDGTGKSTQAKLLKNYLEKENIPAILTREPGGSYVAEQIRNVIINNDLNELTEFLLFYAARSDHIFNTINPALNSGQIVICDRYFDSTEVYQKNLNNLLKIVVREIVVQGTIPNITFLLDMPVEKSLDRLKKRGNLNSFDERSYSFFESVRKGFLEQAKLYPNRIKIIDADRDEEEIHQEILNIIKGDLTSEN